MEDTLNLSPSEQSDIGTEGHITCDRCNETKPRSQYRKVDNPKVCLECYTTERRKNKIESQAPSAYNAKAANAPTSNDTDGEKKKPRATLHLSRRAQSVLTVLSLREKKSQSAVVEDMLMKCYETMDSTERQFVRFIEESSASHK